MTNPFEFPADNPDFLTQSCTRCLECNGDHVHHEQHAFESEGCGILGFCDFWWCDDCGAHVPIGEGEKNEITGEIWWSEQHPRADRDGTAGIDHHAPEPMRYQLRVADVRVRRVEIVPVDDFPPSVNEVLSDFNAPPLQFQRLEAALAGAALLALEIWDENSVRQTTIEHQDEVFKVDEVVARLRGA